MKRMGKDVKFRMKFKGNHGEERSVITGVYHIPSFMVYGFCLKVLLVAGFVIGFIFLKEDVG